MAYSGKFVPRNPQKYKGDSTNIVYRSFWEFRCMTLFDTNDAIVEWSSEETIIPYISPKDGMIHRYFPDFIVHMRNQEKSNVFMIEVKPFNQTQRPKPKYTKTKKPTKKFLNEVVDWSINQAKWEAAKDFCEKRNWGFFVLTEENSQRILGIKFT